MCGKMEICGFHARVGVGQGGGEVVDVCVLCVAVCCVWLCVVFSSVSSARPWEHSVGGGAGRMISHPADYHTAVWQWLTRGMCDTSGPFVCLGCASVLYPRHTRTTMRRVGVHDALSSSEDTHVPHASCSCATVSGV